MKKKRQAGGSRMTALDQVVFLLDVDNTLLDNDRFAIDSGARLQRTFCVAERERLLTVNQVVSRTERGLGAEVSAGSAKQEAL